MQRLRAIHSLAQFSRLVSESAAGSDALHLLADILAEQAGCDAVAVIELRGDRLRLAAARNLPDELRSWSAEADEIDSSLGRVLMREWGDFVESKTMLLVSSGALFGAVVLFWKKPDDGSEPWHDDFAQGLVDLAATLLATSAQMEKLARTNEELRRSREVLARTEKLRALGQMAAGVSHDLKNILNPLFLHLQIAQRANAKSNTDGVAEALGEIREALSHGVGVLERLRNFSRQAPTAKLAIVDLSVLAREALLLAQPRLASASGRLFCIEECYGRPPPVLGEPGEIVSAVLNLLMNAADAMTEGGTITVNTGESEGEGWIAVKDDGPGMSEEVQARVFEPFFTTKGEAGTGLGLAMVYATVRRHGGTVSLDSAPGKGATFTLRFPSRS